MQGRVGLVGDAAGYVTKCSGEGIYFAAKSGRMCAEEIVEQSANGTKMVRPPYLMPLLRIRMLSNAPVLKQHGGAVFMVGQQFNRAELLGQAP